MKFCLLKLWIRKVNYKEVHVCFLRNQNFLSIKEMYQILLVIFWMGKNYQGLLWSGTKFKNEPPVAQSIPFSHKNGENGADNGSEDGANYGTYKGDGESMEGGGGGYIGGRRLINNLSFSIISCGKIGKNWYFRKIVIQISWRSWGE